MDGVKQTVAVVSGAVSQDHSESLLVSAEQELKKSLLLKSSGDVLSSETLVEGNNPSTNGVDSELMNSQFVIEETNFICETKANLESVQPNEVQAENQTLHENLCDNLNSNENAECEEPKDNLEELSLGLKTDNVENKEQVVDSQNLSREQADSLIAQNIGVMVNVKNNSLPVEVSECQKNTEISELVNSDTTEKNVQDLNENNCTSENNVTNFNFNNDIQRVGNSEDGKVITNKESLLEKNEINESDINRNNEAQQETNIGLDEQPTINPSGPLPVTSDTSADTINFQDDKKYESESRSMEETTPEKDKETKEFQDKVMCVQESSDNKISLNTSNECLEKENTYNSEDKVDNVNEKLMENNDLEQISFSENKVQICETVDKSSLVQNEDEVKKALEDEKVMPEVLNVTPVSHVIIEETCLNEKEAEKETEMEVDVEIDKKYEKTELHLKESSTVDDKSKEMDIDYSADFLNINTEIHQNSNSDSQNLEIETHKGFSAEGSKIVRHLSSSEEETITGDTTQQEEEDKKILNKKNENICIIPDEMTLKTPVSAQTRRSRGSIEKKQIENSENSDHALSKIRTPNSEKSKSKLRYKRNLGIDNSKTRPVRSAAKLAGNKIKSLVQNDLAYDELVSSAGEEQEIQENTDGSNKMCSQCKEVKVCRFLMVQGDDTHYFCSESCSGTFMKGSQTYGDTCELEISSGEFVRKCAQCHSQVTIDDKCLFWETMDFCNEDCLGKYQTELGSSCANCKGSVVSSSLGKYCVRFGYEVKQFCSSTCLEEYKKGLKVCSYCQKDISTGTEGFLAPVGDKGQFKDFCTQSCMEKYERMSNNVPPPDVSAECAVCSNNKPVQIEVELDHKTHKLCSEPCFAAFKFVNNIKEGQCDMCRKYFDRVKAGNFFLFFDETPRSFCSKTCMNVYILANRKIVPCNWCKVKKYNFDMIKKVSATGQLSMMCSLNCLMLYQVSVNAVCSRRIKCDFCLSIEQAQYHLTMSDATIRNFCSYNCVMSFQNRYPKQPIDLIPGAEQLNSPIPTGTPKRIVPRRSQVESSCGPVISSVQSLATTNGPASPSGRVSKNRADVNIVPQVTPATQSIAIPTAVAPLSAPSPQIYQQIITKPAPVKQMKNKSVLCKPYSHTKGVSCRPHPCMKETQTDESLNRKFLIPIPVPIYVPTPMHMFATPFPVPVPFPLPVPVPIFIPTTRNSAKGIFKEIKRIQEKIPTDPFEAELLMMAEMVAGEKKQDPTDSESEDGNEGDDGGDGTFIPENVDTSNTFGDDMLQMALKMASELEEPAVDMESVLTSNTITTSSQPAVDPNKALYASDPDDPDQVHVMAMNRGRKRSVRGSRNSAGATPSKRGRRTSGSVDVPLLPPPEPVPPPRIEVEKPDANMCLKYTFGVNAWRHWVMQKNAELEKAAMTNRKIKLFKPELLQLTADELNFSLCLFVKEVRKPNGTEYAPDTIYYLCLGIQQYLFENGRIDNIFTDSYYEKFTDCLDEVAKKFAALYNDSQYIVTRVEEEHLWESKQLGAHSPHVLLSTLMFFNTKHFNLVTVEEHMQLSFSHIMKHWKRNPNTPGVAKVPGSRNVLLRFYPPQSALEANSRKKKVYEQQENEENPLRCPVKLYEFYLSKCPESVKTRNDVFYLLPERSCVPDSPVWYSTMALGKEPLMKMLHRVKMVKEINIALLTC